MPSEQSGGLENFWYSWDYGMVHYIQFNTETDVGLKPSDPDLKLSYHYLSFQMPPISPVEAETRTPVLSRPMAHSLNG